MNRQLLHNAASVTKVVFARLRFLSVFLVAGFIVGYWDNIKNHWDKWTRPPIAPEVIATTASDVEYYCVMHPNVIRSEPGNCPICGMPLVKRKKGEKVHLPQNVMDRVQISPQRVTLAGIQTSEVQPRRLVRGIHAVGVLDYAEPNVAQLSSRVGGRADELFIQYVGQVVNKGDRIYSLYSPELYSAQSAYLVARKRVNELPQDASASTRTDAALAYNAAMEALVNWGITREQLDQMDQAFDKTGKVPSHLIITSPINGVVVRKDIFQGGYVQTGDQPYTIADLSSLWLQLKMYERDFPLVKIDQPVQLQVEALPNEVFHGTITFKSFQLDPETRTLNARVEVKNTDLRLRPGMFADATLAIPLGSEPTTRPATLPTVATPANAQAVYAAIQPYLQVQALLADDKLQGVSELLHEMVAKLQPLGSDARVQRLAQLAHSASTTDLAALRTNFKDLSVALIELSKDTGLPNDAPDIQVFRCPMAKANWIQHAGETSNPFYGLSMRTCGGPIETLPKAKVMLTGNGSHAPAASEVLAIPRSAVIEAGRHRIVYVESSPGVFDMRAVQLGPQAGDYYPVVSGVEQGEKVVTVGAFLIDSENRLNPAQTGESSESQQTAVHQH